MRHYFANVDVADIATGVEDFYFWEQIQTVIKPNFYPQLCEFLMKIIPVINWMYTSAEDDNFLREGWGCVNLMIFIWEFLCFGLTEKALFQVILGFLLVYADWEKGGVCLRVYVRVFHDLELLRYVLCCVIKRQL